MHKALSPWMRVYVISCEENECLLSLSFTHLSPSYFSLSRIYTHTLVSLGSLLSTLFRKRAPTDDNNKKARLMFVAEVIIFLIDRCVPCLVFRNSVFYSTKRKMLFEFFISLYSIFFICIDGTPKSRVTLFNFVDTLYFFLQLTLQSVNRIPYWTLKTYFKKDFKV
jgi:hypothetical protein